MTSSHQSCLQVDCQSAQIARGLHVFPLPGVLQVARKKRCGWTMGFIVYDPQHLQLRMGLPSQAPINLVLNRSIKIRIQERSMCSRSSSLPWSRRQSPCEHLGMIEKVLEIPSYVLSLEWKQQRCQGCNNFREYPWWCIGLAPGAKNPHGMHQNLPFSLTIYNVRGNGQDRSSWDRITIGVVLANHVHEVSRCREQC